MDSGWFCRSIANEQAITANDHQTEQYPHLVGLNSESSEDENPKGSDADFKTRYSLLKKRFKFLIYENEFLQDTLRSSQRRFLKVTRDRSFLLDRLLQYERPEVSSSESNDDTDTSDEEIAAVPKKRKSVEENSNNHPVNIRNVNIAKKKRPIQKKPVMIATGVAPNMLGDTIRQTDEEVELTVEEVERHLQSRQSLIELVPERAPPTVPTEMFSNEPSLDSLED